MAATGYKIRCSYFLAGAAEPCQVIAALDQRLPRDMQIRLKSQYCNSGMFLACPLFRRIQQCLERQGDRLRAMASPV